MASTLDPLEDKTGAGDDGALPLHPTLEILFHSDLDRVGTQTAPPLFGLDRPVSVGRDSPQFGRPEGGAGESLSDPCVSQKQLTITATADDAFLVVPGASARRAVQVASIAGQALPIETPMPSGSLISIGDRVLLLLALRGERAGMDRMGLLGESEPTWAVRDRARAAAASQETVLIRGESGVGKELVARSLHVQGPGRDERHVVVNCAAIPDGLVESELFGHVRGAFSGATRDRQGVFSAAGAGTVFLDEVGELPLKMQGKLLRVLQERKLRPVGALAEQPLRARVIAATNRDLRRDVKDGRFREDLFYRITALTIEVPPLRERREDIPALFVRFLRASGRGHAHLDRFWRRANQTPPPVPLSLLQQLLACDWPGNVRQLANVAHKLVVANLESPSFVIPDEVQHELHEAAGSGTTRKTQTRPAGQSSTPSDPAPQREGFDEAMLLRLLEQNDYILRRVARAAGVSHTTVDRWMRNFGLRRPADLSQAEIDAVAEQTGNNLTEMARSLKVSRRGLKRRISSGKP